MRLMIKIEILTINQQTIIMVSREPGMVGDDVMFVVPHGARWG